MIIDYCRTVQHKISRTGVDSNNRRAIFKLKAAYLLACEFVLHDFPEEFAMTNAYSASPAMGGVTVAIVAHNLPEEFATAG
jgi:zinc transporter ZupT